MASSVQTNIAWVFSSPAPKLLPNPPLDSISSPLDSSHFRHSPTCIPPLKPPLLLNPLAQAPPLSVQDPARSDVALVPRCNILLIVDFDFKVLKPLLNTRSLTLRSSNRSNRYLIVDYNSFWGPLETGKVKAKTKDLGQVEDQKGVSV